MRPLGVIGNVSRDRIAAATRIGGGVFYAGRALRALGKRGVILTKCAERDRAEILTPLVCLGIPVLWHGAPTTAGFTIEHQGDERWIEMDAVGPEWTPEEARGWVRKGLADAEWLHVGALSSSDFPAETLNELARGRRLLLDGQGLLRVARTGPVELAADFDRDALRSLFVLKLSEEEALVAAGGLDKGSLRGLGVPEVLVTLGSRGVIVCADGAVESVPVRRVEGDVDPTGAGDSFGAAYLVGRAAGYGAVGAARRAGRVVTDLLAGGTR
jgi:sugar/nucleoside kinase (ribokinase family)